MAAKRDIFTPPAPKRIRMEEKRAIYLTHDNKTWLLSSEKVGKYPFFYEYLTRTVGDSMINLTCAEFSPTAVTLVLNAVQDETELEIDGDLLELFRVVRYLTLEHFYPTIMDALAKNMLAKNKFADETKYMEYFLDMFYKCLKFFLFSKEERKRDHPALLFTREQGKAIVDQAMKFLQYDEKFTVNMTPYLVEVCRLSDTAEGWHILSKYYLRHVAELDKHFRSSLTQQLYDTGKLQHYHLMLYARVVKNAEVYATIIECYCVPRPTQK